MTRWSTEAGHICESMPLNQFYFINSLHRCQERVLRMRQPVVLIFNVNIKHSAFPKRPHCTNYVNDSGCELTTAGKVVNFGVSVLSNVIYAPLLPIWSLNKMIILCLQHHNFNLIIYIVKNFNARRKFYEEYQIQEKL